MGYYASGSGNIVYQRALTNEEYDQIETALRDAFEDVDGVENETIIKRGFGKSWFDFWNSDKYYEDEVLEALETAAKVAPIEEGCIEYRGEDGALWRFIYKNGNWIEQGGEVVYGDGNSKIFGEVSWNREDILTALDEQYNIEKPPRELVDRILIVCQNDHHFTDDMIEAGWKTIYAHIDEEIDNYGYARRRR